MKPGIIACIAIAMLTSFSVVADDVPVKAQLCVACHSQEAVSANSAWPGLAGQKAAYLEVQIRAFRDGTRSSPEMAPFVTDLDDREITELASYYAARTPLVVGGGDSALQARGQNLSAYCVACHGMNGSPVAATWPKLAGQNAAYLAKQMAAFKNEERLSSLMQAAIKPFGQTEFAALAAYYSRLDP